ncbi:TPA: regulatory protein RecX [Legionella feeleii]
MTTLFDAALKHLSSRHCSERELCRFLEKEFSSHPDLENAITQTIARLRELHLINDERIAESLSLRYRHKGNRFIRNVLRQKGLSDELIEKTLAQCGDEYERALEVLHKKLYSIYRTPDKKTMSRLYSFLSSRGFSQDVIHQAINNLQEDGIMSE